MNLDTTAKFKKQYDKLPRNIQIKTQRILNYLKEDLRYPSIHAKKKQGEDMWEGRVDRFYRFTFTITEDTITLRTIGPHDEALG